MWPSVVRKSTRRVRRRLAKATLSPREWSWLMGCASSPSRPSDGPTDGGVGKLAAQRSDGGDLQDVRSASRYQVGGAAQDQVGGEDVEVAAGCHCRRDERAVRCCAEGDVCPACRRGQNGCGAGLLVQYAGFAGDRVRESVGDRVAVAVGVAVCDASGAGAFPGQFRAVEYQPPVCGDVSECELSVLADQCLAVGHRQAPEPAVGQR